MDFTQEEKDVLHSALLRAVEDLDGYTMDFEGVEYIDKCKALITKLTT